MAFVRDGAQNAEKMVGRQDSEKAKANDRSRLESATAKIGVRRFDNVIETGDLLVELGADAAN